MVQLIYTFYGTAFSLLPPYYFSSSGFLNFTFLSLSVALILDDHSLPSAFFEDISLTTTNLSFL